MSNELMRFEVEESTYGVVIGFCNDFVIVDMEVY